MKNWYPPGEIRFTIKQTLWLIQNLSGLRCGHWPPESSSYIDIPGRKGISGRAPYTTPVEYAAEILSRMERCGIDGLILLALESWGESEQSLAAYLRRPTWVISRRYRRALRYVASGPVRRWHDSKKRQGESYQDFKKRGKTK